MEIGREKGEGKGVAMSSLVWIGCKGGGWRALLERR